MKKKNIRLMAVILALALLTACGSPDAGQEPEELSSLEEFVYAGEYHSFVLASNQDVQGCTADGNLYLLTTQAVPMAADSGTVTRVSLDGTLEEVFSSDRFMDGIYGSVAPLSLCAGEKGTFWLLLDCRPNPADVGSVPRGTFLCRFDSLGEELERLDITQAVMQMGQEPFYSVPLQVDGDGWIYLYSYDSVYVLDNQQQFRFSLSYDTTYTPYGAVLPDGRAAGLFLGGSKGPGEPQIYEVRAIDKEAKDWGEAYPVAEYCQDLFSGSGEYLFFVNTLDAICGWNAETGELETLLDKTNSDVDFSSVLLEDVAALEDGRLTVVTWDRDSGKGEVAVLTPADPSELPEKTVLTLACIWCPSKLQQYVTEFNKASQDCRVEIKEYGSVFERAEGMQRMIVDITAGNMPDLLYMDGLSVKKFGSKGILEDLWPYIDGDPEVGREDLMSHALECAEVNGKLYEIFSSFQIQSVAGAASVVGDRISWTIEDLQAALATMPEGCSAYNAYESSSSMLYQLVNANMDSYVDWGTGTCSFEGQEFKDLLAYVDSLGLSADEWNEACMYPESYIIGQEQMLYYTGSLLTQFRDLQICEGIFGGPVSYVGHPKLDGACGSSFYIGSESTPIAMTASCKDKEEAWSFLRTILLPQAVLPEYPAGFPINRTDFEAQAQRAMEQWKEGTTVGQIFQNAGGSEFRVNPGPFTQAEYDQFMELYNAIDSLYSEDSDVLEAVMSETSVYFAGDITLDEAASRIQKRVQLYMDEQS